MSEPENFLTRWSRRKADGPEKHAEPKAAPAEEKSTTDDQDVRADAPTHAAPSETAPPPFDPATLPPIESIGAETDITMFLRVGVPADLTRAALRRAWAADPTIRDFIGLSENSWDFTAPDGVPGFGPLTAEESSRLLAQFTGKAKQVVEQIEAFEAPVESVQAGPTAVETGHESVRYSNCAEHVSRPEDAEGGADPSDVQREMNYDAPQNNSTEPDDSRPTPRIHGSALPK